MKILWLSPRWPFPDNTGARKATMALLSEMGEAAASLKLNDFTLSLVCLYETDGDLATVNVLEQETGAVDNLYLEKPNLLGGSNGLTYLKTRLFHPTVPFTIQKYSSRFLKQKMNAWMSSRSFDFTIIDGLHGAAFIDMDDPRFGKFIYRAHNVESELWRQLAVQEQNAVKKSILRFEHRLSEGFEMKVCQRSQLTFTVSDLDKAKFQSLWPAIPAKSLPIGAAIEDQPLPFAEPSQTLQLLFVGRLDWEPNKKGLDWFLKEVWPKLAARRSVKLTIIGSGDSDWLQHFESSDLRLLRNVPSLKSYYQECHLTLIPLFMGSGTRVKAIESGNFGRSFLSTRIGVEGLPYTPTRDYLVAETADEWLQALTHLDLQTAESLGRKIHSVTKFNFEKRSLAIELLENLQNPHRKIESRKEHHEIPHSQHFSVS